MNKRLIALCALGGLAVASVSANQIQVGYPGSSFGPYQTGNGGEFTYNDVNPEGWLDLSSYASTTKNIGPVGITSFQTFCIEIGETISGYSATYNAVISPNATENNDPISVGTGWLYSQFASGTLAGYDYGTTVANRKATAGLLQNAIWWLEEEGPSYNASNPFMLAAVTQFGSEAAARANGGWNYGVYAVNLTTTSGGKVQDGLYFSVPDGGATAMLMGLGMVGMAIVARRRD